MSRHHTLPPILYTPPPPKPKKTEKRRGIRNKGSVDETEETEETGAAAPGSAARNASALPDRETPVEATERRVPSPNGKLSDGTLKMLLEVQEQEGGESTPQKQTP